jgi:G3E family GTPase
MAVKRMEEEGVGAYLDAMVCVVDCVNFAGYEDTSYTAKLQARYTDLVLLNKWEHVRYARIVTKGRLTRRRWMACWTG